MWQTALLSGCGARGLFTVGKGARAPWTHDNHDGLSACGVVERMVHGAPSAG
jgi:hypothetical protein